MGYEVIILMADASPVEATYDDLPAALPYAVSIHVRNSDLQVDESGNASRLDTHRILATIKSRVNPGTVFFTSIDMRALNATARGLIRVLSQRPLEDGIGIETLAEFVELSDDAKTKILRLLGGGPQGVPIPAASPPPARNFAMEQLGVQPVYQRQPQRADFQVASTEPRYFEPAPTRQKAEATKTTKFWSSIGVTGYAAIILIIGWFFPAARAYEILAWHGIVWFFAGLWHAMTHVGDVKLYNNT